MLALLKKKNTFYDFIDCGQFLVDNNYTSPEHLYAQGGSAGGLLMGAIINIEPALWNGIIAGVPFVDVISTMLDETIPLTTGEFDEWGNPKNKEYYDYIEKYILPNEDYKVQIQWLNGEMEYDDEYIREHLENNNIKLI